MTYEFEGRTEKEAIDKAAEELGLTRDSFDVEIVETQKGGLFKKGFVKIRVHSGTTQKSKFSAESERAPRPARAERKTETLPAGDDFEKALIEYLEKLIALMNFSGKAGVQFREGRKLGLKIESPDSAMLIGRKGKTLDALQLILNIHSDRLGRDDLHIILDCENYRVYREESLVRLAYTVADKVRETRRSMLLEPMNPFDRRLIHTTLNDINDIETKSEGEGMYKQVRVILKGSR
ncbi:MAG: protein jag [Spirochaetaceae bacterium]|jgi:spoIIIJ-associated protein|nr:protein jag [Spirochaetaceae bacterium]